MFPPRNEKFGRSVSSAGRSLPPQRSVSQLVGLWLCLLVGLTACAAHPPASARPWLYTDLLARDPADAASPESDLLALYARREGDEWQFRLDLLDFSADESSLALALDFQPGSGGSEAAWDLLVRAGAGGSLSALDAHSQPVSGLRLRLQRDPLTDMIVLSLPADALPLGSAPFRIQVFTPDDQMPPVSSAGTPPAPTPLALVFYQTFPAATPAQALRSWDGAHSGPERARHGLRNLLAAVADQRIPVVLLDVTTAPALSALDFLNAMPTLRTLADRGLLVLAEPRWLEGWPDSDAARSVYHSVNRRAAADWALPLWPWPEGAHWQAWQFADDGRGATPDGPSLDARRALANAGPQGVVFGGDFSVSTWGIPAAVQPSFAWLAAHPWVQTAGAAALTRQASHFPTLGDPLQPEGMTPQGAAQPANGQPASGADFSTIETALLTAPPSAITRSAWQMLFALLPTGQPRLDALRQQMWGLSGHLLAAAQWEANPYSAAHCAIDLDWDGQNECVLASPRVFAVIEPQGAALTALFYRDAQGTHQWVGPTAQFAVGLSDPLEWRPAAGIFADPAAPPGAFVDQPQANREYQPLPGDGEITFTAADGAGQKVYTLLDDGLQVRYFGGSPDSTRLTLALDPWERFSPGRSLPAATARTGGWQWQSAGGLRFESDGVAALLAFSDSLPVIAIPEDPNSNYPPGHFLPFPLLVITAGGAVFTLRAP